GRRPQGCLRFRSDGLFQSRKSRAQPSSEFRTPHSAFHTPMPHIQIYDTTLRDGAQGEGVSFSLEDKLLVTRRLDELGFDYIEGGYPLSNEKDAGFFRRARELELRHAKVCAFGMTRRRGMLPKEDVGMQALLESHAPVLTIVGKTSDFHATEVLRVSLEENLAMIRDTVDFLRQSGREVIYDA